MAIGLEVGENAARVQQLIEHLARMAGGEKDLRIPIIGTEDEIDAIAYGINVLADELMLALQKASELQLAAERSNQSKSVFLAHMSHEIRTPLASIIGFSDLLAKADAEVNRADFIRRIRNNCNSLRKLIDNVLDLSKVESGELTLEQIEVNLLTTISEGLTSFEPSAQAKQVELKLEFSDSLPRVVITDPLRLWQIINNLVGNALKFSDSGVISTRVELLPNQLLCITVRDQGQGIPAENSANLFQPFRQGDNSIARKFGGSGLGLALTRAICRAMGGDLVLESSELNVGSCFVASVKVELPVNALVPIDSNKVATTAAIAPLHGKTVMIAEDNEDCRLLISQMLLQSGAEVHLCHDGQAALDLAVKLKRLDLIILDIQMPYIDGITAAMKLRANGINAPLLALTAHSMQGERERCLQAGFSDYMTKPVEADNLVGRIGNVLLQREK